MIQKVLEHCSTEQKQPVLEALFANLKKLVVDQYGNYVIQHIIGEIQDTSFLFFIELDVFQSTALTRTEGG